MIFGIDTASYQGDPDFDRVRSAGIGFVITKLTEGVGYVNPHAARTRAEAHRVGLGLGLYHFADGGDPAAEAGHFLAALGPLAAGDVLALDWECAYTGDPVSWCLAWLTRVRAATTVAPLLYINKSTLAGHDWAPVVAGGFGLWLADYDFQPTIVPGSGAWPVLAVKQYSDRGVIAGVAGPVDLDTFFGTLEQFRAYGAPIPVPVPVPVPVPRPVPAPVVVPPPAPRPAPGPNDVQPGPWDALPTLTYGTTSVANLRWEQFLARYAPSYFRATPATHYGDATAAATHEFARRCGVTADTDGRTFGPRLKRAAWAVGFRG